MSLTLVEKILQKHLSSNIDIRSIRRGEDYIELHPDRVIMQDATAQMTMLQFIQSGLSKVAVPASIHCDHLIPACSGMREDIVDAKHENDEVYSFLASTADRFGIDYWSPGSGIIHQVAFENYIIPGTLVIGTDSHTPTGGGLGALCIGVGGADAVDVLTGQTWQLKMPKIINIKLEGELQNYTSAKDIILYILGILGSNGGTDYVLEYSGEGCKTLSATERATICNMGAECGATTSIFPSDNISQKYLKSVDRDSFYNELYADSDAEYDRIISINLNEITPQIALPGNPANTISISEVIQRQKYQDYGQNIESILIGSCTNSSLDDIRICSEIANFAMKSGLSLKTELIIIPGSMSVFTEAFNRGYIQILRAFGAKIMTCSCGPCIGQWKRHHSSTPNTILTTFNRNFTGRNDGSINTYSYIVSPITAMRYSLTGTMTRIEERVEYNLHEDYTLDLWKEGLVKPSYSKDININKNSERLQLLEPWEAWNGEDMTLHILKKVEGQCTTDHISPAGKWLRYRGHLGNISQNFLLGKSSGDSETPYQKAKRLDTDLCIIGDWNYGEGSSREHAALEARYLGVKAVIAKSFARIHETNLKKQGVCALRFENDQLYNLIEGDDIIFIQLSKRNNNRTPITIRKKDSRELTDFLIDTYNDKQWKWFVKGSALNTLNKE